MTSGSDPRTLCDTGGLDPSRRSVVAIGKRGGVMQYAHDPPLRTIEVELMPTPASAFAATLRLSGEHDLATRRDIQDALEPIDGDVLVDLSACEFIDSSVIVMLLAAHYAARREGRRLELLLPAENRTITRTLELSGARQLLTVHLSRP